MNTPIGIVGLVARIVTNGVVFGLLGAVFGTWGIVIGAVVGAGLGAVHGVCLARAHSYPDTARGWALLAIDSTWSLPNTVVGSVFLAANLLFGNRIDAKMSARRTTLVMHKGVSSRFATTIGPVEAGTKPGIDRHEYVHVFQSRLFGPLYLPLVVANYVVATIIPYWLLYHDRSAHPIRGFGDYFMRGVYPHVWNEEWAYKIEGVAP